MLETDSSNAGEEPLATPTAVGPSLPGGSEVSEDQSNAKMTRPRTIAVALIVGLGVYLLLGLGIDVEDLGPVGHTGFFVAMCLPLAGLAALVGGRRAVLRSLMLLAAFAVAREFLQTATMGGSTRGALKDVIADFVGVAVAGGVISIARSRLGDFEFTRMVDFGSWSSVGALASAVVLLGPAGFGQFAGEDEVCERSASNEEVAVEYDLTTDALPQQALVSLGGTTLSKDGYSFDGDGLVSLGPAAPLACQARRTGVFAVRASVTPATLDQFGPRRIVSISDGTVGDDANMNLAIEGSTLSVRINTGSETGNLLVDDVFDAGTPVDLEVVLMTGRVVVLVDGIERIDSPVSVDFGRWDPSRPLLLGNEATGTRGFVGTIASINAKTSL